MTDKDQHSASYYPPPESQGGWRWLASPDEVRGQAGMKEEALDQARQVQEFLFGGDSWGIVIIRHGYLVREYYTFGASAHTSFDIHSGTKSFTGTAWGLLLEDSRLGCLPHGQTVTLDSPAYDFLPEGAPLSDPRKALIRIRHLLTMTSGIPGEASVLFGTPTTTGNGPFEFALGRCPNRYGKWASQLTAEPGTRWDYSDPAMSHLSLAFAHIMPCEMSDYLQERVCEPIGIEHLSWDILGGSGSIGPHSNAYTGIHISARELARFGYLFLHQGAWNEQQLIPRSWVELATKASQDLNPAYGYNWWVGARWPNLPPDTFALTGFRSNRCYIIPSLDLVVARVGTGPAMWDEGRLISSIVGAIV